MGRQIVYCEACGNSLREDDFERGKARTLDGRPFCTECRPYKVGEEAPKRSSSGKVPAPPPPPQRKSATGPIPIIAAPGRRSAPSSASKQSNPLPIIAGLGGVVLLILIVAVTQSGPSRPPAPPPEPSTPLIVDIPRRQPPSDPPPPPPPRDPQPPPPPPPPRRDPPSNPSKSSDPLVAPSAAQKFESFLGQIRQMIQDDGRKERAEEILRMFVAAAKIAGPRATEVEKMKNEYLGTLDEPTRRAAVWSEWKVTSSAEPGQTGVLPSYGDRSSVYMTHPLDKTTPARLEREVDVPSGKKTTLSFWVACHQQGDFELRVFVDDKQVLKELIGPPGSGWRQKTVDLSLHAGKRIALRLEDFPNDWKWEYAYWSDVTITSE
ncbi:MAG: hypothetical protein HY293_11700 [Planctomycetes bacterium]|nr:hypothetical protein [Planctomycetota bacterium]